MNIIYLKSIINSTQPFNDSAIFLLFFFRSFVFLEQYYISANTKLPKIIKLFSVHLIHLVSRALVLVLVVERGVVLPQSTTRDRQSLSNGLRLHN